MEIRFTIEKDCRSFKEGENHVIVPEKEGILYISGRNGSGKSTLLHIMRRHLDSLKAMNLKITVGMEDPRIETASLEPIKMEGFEYDEAFYLDSVTDDPINMYNSASASGFLQGGGMESQRHSRGENSIVMLDRFRTKITKYLTDKYGSVEEWKKTGKRGLIVLDEIDEGLDIPMQFGFNVIIETVFINEFGCDVICVSHNAICMKSVCDCPVHVYDMFGRSKMIVDEYITLVTGRYIEITMKPLQNQSTFDKDVRETE